MIPMARTHRAAQRVPGWRIGWAISMRCCQVTTRKAWPWIIVGNVFGESHLCKFLKRVGAKNSFFSSLPSFPYFYSGSQKSLTHPFPHFYVFFFIYYWTCSRPEYSWNTVHWMIGNKQSINPLSYYQTISIYCIKKNTSNTQDLFSNQFRSF